MALPRKVHLMILAPLIGLLGLAYSVIGVNQYNKSASLEAEGVKVPGKVVERTKSGRLSARTYHLMISYEPKPGDPPMQHQFRVSKAGFDEAGRVPDVHVRILPRDPKVAQLVGYEFMEDNGPMLLAFGVGSLMVSIFLFLQFFKKPKPEFIGPAV